MAMGCTHSERAVPITMGSFRFVTEEVDQFRCTQVWFPPEAELEPHTHDRATFAVMLEGGFDLRFGSPAIRRRVLEIGAGTVFTEPAGETHANAVGSGGASLLVVQIATDVSDPKIEPLRALLDDRVACLRNGVIETCARRLAAEIRSSDALSGLSIEALALEMLVRAGRKTDRWMRVKGSPPWLDRAEEFIRDNFREPLRLADVAEVAGVHPAHLASVFSEVNGIPVATFIRKLRLEWVADQLASSSDSLAAVAYRAGFSDQSHMTRAFKKHTGRTPGEYRKTSM